MGKREQFIRTLLRAAEAMGWPVKWAGLSGATNLEERVVSAEEWMRATDRRMSTRDTEAWLSILDTMQCMAPAGGTSDEPRAATRRCV